MQATKNKEITYLLICAVALVWGIIVYRLFFSEPAEDTPGFFPVKAVHEPFDQYVVNNDTFKLAVNYRDPFLGKMNVSPVVAEAAAKEPQVPLPVKPMAPPINWSVVRYSGYITNPKTKKLVAIVTVNGRERMIAEGESFEGVKLVKNKKDSILVSWMGKQKYIRQ